MKRFSIRRAAPAFLAALVGLLASANVYGANVDLATLLANPGFEIGNQPPNPGDTQGCPISWTCSGSPSPGATSYAVTSAQFSAGPSDGLGAGLLTPGGTRAATCPTPVEGSCFLRQLNLGTYVAGNTYTISFWVGTPLTLPIDNVTPVGKVATLRFYFLGTNSAGLQATDIVVPNPGQWKLVTLSFTPTGSAIGQGVGIGIFVDSGGNNQLINLDIAAPCTCTTF